MFLRNKIVSKVIQFYPWAEDTADWRPAPTPASTKMPDWYKKIRPYGKDSSYSQVAPNVTIKKCVPILDAMTAGYMVVLSNDIVVEKVDGKSTINWPYGGNLLETHSPLQIVPEFIPKGFVPLPIKWMFNYGIKLPKGYSLLVVHPINRNDLPFQTITGLVDADTYNKPINFPFFIREDFVGIIESGTPIAQLIPIKRDLWSSEMKEFDKGFVTEIDSRFYAKAVNCYRKLFWAKKSYN